MSGVDGMDDYRAEDYEAGALAALDYITDEREDLEDLTMRVAEKIGADILAHRDRLRGAVEERDALRRAADDVIEGRQGAMSALRHVRLTGRGR